MLKPRRVEQPQAAPQLGERKAAYPRRTSPDWTSKHAHAGSASEEQAHVIDSAGAAQVRAARAAAAASSAASLAAPAPFVPIPLPATNNHAHALAPVHAQPRSHALPPAPQQDPGSAVNGGAISSLLPSKVAVVVDEIVTDSSCKRVNSAGITVYKQYKRGRYLGKGGFAKCYELQSLDSLRVYAGKIIPKASITKASAKKKLIAEISIHRKIHHTNVVKFERFFEDSQNVYILLEICSNHTLMELVKRRQRLTETETQFYMWQLTNTMIYLHSLNIIHRDLKLGNLFLNSDLDIRIGDFGLAAQLEHPEERKRTICGTPNYIAPEILDNSNGHSFEVDTWAMGVIMYTMLIGQPPFETASVKSTYKRIRDNSYEFPSHVSISPAARSLIERILSASPNARPTLTEMKNDPFFTQSPFPKQLPLSCMHAPLQWNHTWHTEQAVGQENMVGGVVAPSMGGAARPALTSRALNTMAPSSTVAPNKIQSVTRPVTAPATRLSGEHKVASPLSHAPSQPKRLSSATPIDVCPLAAPLSMAPTPSPTYATEDANPKAFFKELMPSATTAAANNPQIAVPKRTSGGERRSSRRSGGEEQRSERESTEADVKRLSSGSAHVTSRPATASVEEDLVSGMKALDLKPAEAAHPSSHAEDVDADDDQEDVRKMHDEIERSFCAPAVDAAAKAASKPVAPAAAPLVPAELWVNKWVDYSNKYGLGYLLSNGDSGVYFNDSSKAILSADGVHFEYLERKSAGDDALPERQFHTITEYPPTLQKKVTLLKHFMNYLVPSPASGEDATAKTPSLSVDASGGRVYVKKWLRTKHAIFFRLSNRTVQVIFLDHTELVLSSQHNSVTYTDKHKRRETFSLDGDAAHTAEKPDLAKRMKYTKDILHHLLTRNTHATSEKKAERQ